MWFAYPLCLRIASINGIEIEWQGKEKFRPIEVSIVRFSLIKIQPQHFSIFKDVNSIASTRYFSHFTSKSSSKYAMYFGITDSTFIGSQ